MDRTDDSRIGSAAITTAWISSRACSSASGAIELECDSNGPAIWMLIFVSQFGDGPLISLVGTVDFSNRSNSISMWPRMIAPRSTWQPVSGMLPTLPNSTFGNARKAIDELPIEGPLMREWTIRASQSCFKALIGSKRMAFRAGI